MKYKVGDKVVLGPKKWQSERLKEAYPNFHPLIETGFVTIKAITGKWHGVYDAVEGVNGKEICIHESQILGHYFQYGEEIEVKDLEDEWMKETWKFSCYDPYAGGFRAWHGDDKSTLHWINARPLQPPQEDVGQPTYEDIALNMPSGVMLDELARRHGCDDVPTPPNGKRSEL